MCGIYKRDFFKRKKTRFLCDVAVGDKEIECYIPASCKIGKLVDLTGKEVVLQPVESIKARTDYSVYAARLGRYYVLLNLAEANRVMETQLHRKNFSFLGKRNRVYKEKFIDGYKADLCIEDTRTIIEIKTVLSLEKDCAFPSVYSKRAEQQLGRINELLIKGYKVAYVIISLNPVVRAVYVNENMKEYYLLFKSCIENGMKVCAFSLTFNEMQPYIKKRIPCRV